jgi:hypothetical protein
MGSVAIGLSLGSNAQPGPGMAPVVPAFSLAFTGLSDGEARPGGHGAIGYALTPPDPDATPAWGMAAGDDSYGSGAHPADFTPGTGGSLWLTLSGGMTTIAISTPIRHALPLVTGALADVSIAAGDPALIDASAGFAFAGPPLYTLVQAPGGMTIDPATGLIDAVAVLVGSAMPIVVRLSDAMDPARFAETGFTLTVTAAPEFVLSQTVDGEVEIDDATGILTVTILAPAIYATHDAGQGPGVFPFDVADLGMGPVPLVPPHILAGDTPAAGDEISLVPGLWIYDPDNGGPAPASHQWQADTGGNAIFADIAGATGVSHTLTPAEAGNRVRVIEQLTDSAGTRVATSLAVPVAAPATSPPILYIGEVPSTGNIANGASAVSSGAISAAGSYVVALCDIGGGRFQMTGPGSVTKLVEHERSDNVTVAWFHLSASGAGDLVVSNTDSDTSWARRLFLYSAPGVSGAVRASTRADSTNSGPGQTLTATVSGLSAGDVILAAVADRNETPTGFLWGGDLTGDGDAAFYTGTSGFAVASDTATGPSFAGSVSEPAIASARSVLSLIALVPT